MAMTIGSLFSGVAGLELGLEVAGLGPVIWQAERDPFCLAVLAKHYPNARRYTDVREIDATTDRPDVICGGFPCQDLSLAGKQSGLSADRSGLWWEFRRIVRVLRPRFVVVENVHGAWRKWLPVVRRGLWKVGYASLPLRVSADSVGADHERNRVFVVAHAEGLRPDARRTGELRWLASVGDGNGHVRTHPDADRARELQPQRRLSDQWGRASDGDGWAVEPVLRGSDYGDARGLDRRAASRHRAAREKALGNAVVPQAAREAWLTAMELTGWAP